MFGKSDEKKILKKKVTSSDSCFDCGRDITELMDEMHVCTNCTTKIKMKGNLKDENRTTRL